MGKAQLDDKLDFERAVGVKRGFVVKSLSICKFILSLALLPLVIGLTSNFSSQLMTLDRVIVNNFVSGIIWFLVIDLFFFPIRNIYDFGQRIVGSIFNFFLPLRTFLFYVLPFFSLIIFAVFCVVKFFFSSYLASSLGYFIFFISFSYAMHLIITATCLKEEEMGELWGEYLFTLTFVYLFGIILFASFLLVITDKFNFVDFLSKSYTFFIDILKSVLKQLFVLRH